MSALPPLPAAPPAPGGNNDAIVAAIWYLVPEKFRKPLQDSKLLRGFLLLALWTIVAPFAMTLLVSLWLKGLNSWASSSAVGSGLASAVRGEIVELVHEGFSMSDPVEKSNNHLDYYQRIYTKFAATKPTPEITRINIEPRQQMKITFRKVEMYATDANCSVTAADDLVEVKLGNAPVRVLSRVDNVITVKLDAKWWDQHEELLLGDATSQPLVLRATDKVADKKCAEIVVDADVLVYKSFYKPKKKVSS